MGLSDGSQCDEGTEEERGLLGSWTEWLMDSVWAELRRAELRGRKGSAEGRGGEDGVPVRLCWAWGAYGPQWRCLESPGRLELHRDSASPGSSSISGPRVSGPVRGASA